MHCGASAILADFDQVSGQASTSDLCRAVAAAAVFGEPKIIDFMPLTTEGCSIALRQGKVDLGSRLKIACRLNER